jgi:ADP-ribose pyrophosphatase YjhB (NUDIX family)
MPTRKSLVLYCLIRKQGSVDAPVRFFLMRKQGYFTFPATKFRPGEDLYTALRRPLEEDLGLPTNSCFPEKELAMIPNEGTTVRSPGLSQDWNLYPVDISLTDGAWKRLDDGHSDWAWWTIDELLANAKEPNVLAVARFVKVNHLDLIKDARSAPSMEALASHWAHQQRDGVRTVRGEDIRSILGAGNRAFNIRVADPYLPYQRQGLGFTWSFFTPKDKQDLHVHGMPAVEIYGVINGRLQLWSKPINQRGVRTWQCTTLGPGDWAEVEPLTCHFACWLDSEGYGTVIKAASEGELAGVGRIGVAGKTVCQDCSVHTNCSIPPRLLELMAEYQKPFEQRDYDRIRENATEGEADVHLHTPPVRRPE